MKICYIAPKNIHSKRWVEYFVKKRHDIHMITPEFDDIPDVKIYTIDPKVSKLSPIFKAIMIRNLIRKINPEVLHAHYAVPFGLYGALCNFHPLIVSAWGSDVLTGPKISRFNKWMAQFALNKADLITCDGENSKEAMINLNIDPNKMRLIYHGVDTQKFSKKEDFREKLFASNSKIVISIRNLEPVYNIETLIESIPYILRRLPDTRFIIGGNGSMEQELNKLAESLGILSSIKFIGQISHDELPNYFSSSDVYVSTSLSDGGVAVSTLEAMACGLAPVVTDVGDNKKWIKDGENGFIVDKKNHELLAEKIIYLIENENVRKRFGDENSKLIKERANYYTEMFKMEKLYEEVIARYKQ